MSGNPWGKKEVGGATKLDWSEQVEEEEAQNGGTLSHKAKAQEPDSGAFPTLGEAAKVKAPKKKMTLAEFQKVPEAESSGKYRVGGYGRRELTEQEIKMSLPTGPRERDPNEPRGGDRRGGWGEDRGGGGFRQGGYGSSRYDDGPRREDEGASRADESDNWGREKKFVSSGGGGGGGYGRSGGGGGGFGSSYDEFHGKADEASNWKMGNKFTPSGRSSGGFGGGGFRDSRDTFDRSSRGYGFRTKADYDDPPGNRADTEDRWGSRRSTPVSSGYDPPRERPRLQLSARTKPLGDSSTPQLETRSSTRSSVFGEAKPREEVLKERRASEAMSMSAGSDAGSVPGSHYDARTASNPGTPASAMDSMRSGQEAFHPKPRADPFGGARPREENLTRSRETEQRFCVEEISH